MAKIMFAPFPETGHINASFKLAKGLKSRGHQVDYSALPDFEEYIVVQGLGFVPIFEKLCPKGFMNEQATEKHVDNFDAFMKEAIRAYPADPFLLLSKEIVQVLKGIGPDLVIVDLLLPDLARIADREGVSVLFLNTQFYNPWAEGPSKYESVGAISEIILCPQEFDFHSSTRAASRKVGRYHVEPSIDLKRAEVEFPWEKLDDGKLLFYCSLGSQGHIIRGSRRFFQVVIDAFGSRKDWQLILATGEGWKTQSFEPCPPNVIVVRTAPQLKVLRRACLMITHGGFNTVKECLYFGVPMIVAPLIRDHPAVAARVIYHGLGMRASFDDCTVEQILLLIESIVNSPLIKGRVQLMGERFRKAEESSQAVGIVEEHLSRLQKRPA